MGDPPQGPRDRSTVAGSRARGGVTRLLIITERTYTEKLVLRVLRVLRVADSYPKSVICDFTSSSAPSGSESPHVTPSVPDPGRRDGPGAAARALIGPAPDHSGSRPYQPLRAAPPPVRHRDAVASESRAIRVATSRSSTSETAAARLPFRLP